MTDAAIASIPLKTIAGNAATLGDYAGEVLLVVNVASKCGLTPQYAGLEALYERYAAQRFRVLGFPANDFAGQEPGSDAEIGDFCSTNYSVTFPMFSKISVAGPDRHPLYTALTAAQPAPLTSDEGMRALLTKHGMTPNPAGEMLWNFEKFLIGRDGTVIARFSPDTTPDDPRLIETIEAALAR